MTLLDRVKDVFRPALAPYAGPASELPDLLAQIKPTGDPSNGDYQANMAMRLKKVANKPPVEIAKDLVAALPKNDLIASATVAGPGFINIGLADAALADAVRNMAADDRLGVAPAANPLTFVIDLSGPNVAKPLHVGHLRSTIIGDALVRILRFAGHTVVGDNHLGDWGTQFGILLYGYKNHLDEAAYRADPVRELARLYVHVRGLFKKATDDDDEIVLDDPVKDACRRETAKLHAGDPENNALWRQFMPACLDMLKPIYDRLDVHIDHALGESFYNPMLPGIVEDLLAKGIAVESNGAVVVPNAKGVIPKPGETKEEPPALVRKRDGAFTYTTTDFATIKYRVETWNPDAMLYVVDSRQALHFKTLFANAARWGYPNVRFEHLKFGSILGPDKRPFQTRTGGVVELDVVLEKAVALGREKYLANSEARRGMGHKVAELGEAEIAEIAEAVGIGAVKYADLSQNRTSDYAFDYDKMLATDGNTATYMQYAYARCRAIFREGGIDPVGIKANPPAVHLGTPQERTLAVHLLRFGEAVDAAAAEFFPHVLTQYLWDLAKAYNGFYEACPVLKADEAAAKQGRLVLVDLTARVLQKTLGLLGIRTVERM